MSVFDDLIAGAPLAQVRVIFIGYLQAAGSLVTSWVKGSDAEQWLETTVSTIWTATQNFGRTARGYSSIENAYDPGDADPLYPDNSDLPPAAGYLSNTGANWYDTTREGATAAVADIVMANTQPGATAQTYIPNAVTLTWANLSPPTPAPTYRPVNQASYEVDGGGTITAGPDGSILHPVDVTLLMTVECEQFGEVGNAPVNAMSLTTVLGTMAATNTSQAIGSDREARDTYIAKCKQAPKRNSLGGPGGALEYLATKTIEGEPLVNASGNPTSITKVQSSEDSSIGVATVYYATGAGGSAVPTEDVTAANENILSFAYATPDAVTLGPLTSSTGDVAVGGPGGAKATNTTIAISGTYRFRRVSGVDPATIPARIVAAIAAFFESNETNPIGGQDKDGTGAGTIYQSDIQEAAGAATTASGGNLGVYNVVLATPAGDTVIAAGHVAVPSTSTGDWTVAP